MGDEISCQYAKYSYFNCKLNREVIKLLPGEFYVSNNDLVMETVLGSCVAACVYDPSQGIGGMNHFLLPAPPIQDREKDRSSARYGEYAMDILITEVIRMGAIRSNLEVKLFGGGNVQRNMTEMNIGEKNANFAMDYVKRKEIHLAGYDLVDIYPRKIIFYPKDGLVMVKKLMIEPASIINDEKNYESILKNQIDK
ncbi:MAG: chemoreceptor glutamine deamidase CheD [Nitrosomonas sp.]|nr:MAG: chemoreceptor glutamine deamidase CheD [Nitrosomonas sp.]